VPFTISHAAAVLPLQRIGKTRLPLAALMIGSMSPDFSYFVPGEFSRLATHSLVGLFLFCWPASLAVWILYVRLFEQPTIALLPETWRLRIPQSTRELNFRTLALVSAAIILGAVTHDVWDAFTHAHTAITKAFPVLSAVAFVSHGAHVRWYAILWGLSSILGMVALMIWAWKLLRHGTPALEIHEPRFSLAISNKTRLGAVLLLCASACAFALTAFMTIPEFTLERHLFNLAVGGMTGWALAWFAIAVLINRRARHCRR
jgi:hypothetical protein